MLKRPNSKINCSWKKEFLIFRVIRHVICHYGVCTCIVDVYSYDEDDMVEDPKLAEHLAHFGIDVMKMQKVGLQSLIKE